LVDGYLNYLIRALNQIGDQAVRADRDQTGVAGAHRVKTCALACSLHGPTQFQSGSEAALVRPQTAHRDRQDVV
jgi:hypothetical protein